MDLELKTCDFDPDAEAMVLSDYGQEYLDFRGDNIYKELVIHVRIKILKDKGQRPVEMLEQFITATVVSRVL